MTTTIIESGDPAETRDDGLSCAESSALSASAHSRRVMTSSKDMTWATPQEWFNYLDLEFDFTLDPCCSHQTAKCKKHYTPEEDGLSQSWRDERVFMNPPYGRDIVKWMKKAYEEAHDNGALVVCFVPARVDTEWWHRYAVKGEVRFPKGRVKFAGADAAAPFPMTVVIFRPRVANPKIAEVDALPDGDKPRQGIKFSPDNPGVSRDKWTPVGKQSDAVLPDGMATPLLHARKLTISQAAKMLSVGQTKVREWIKKGEIAVVILDGKYLFLETDLEDFLRRHYGPVSETEIKKPGLVPLPESVTNSNLLRKAA